MTTREGQGQDRRIRFAVVGLGPIAQAAILPSFGHTRDADLVAIAGRDREKLRLVGQRFGVARRVELRALHAFCRSGAVDAVYIAMPTHLQAEMAISAAEAGVHVLCEPPMAVCEEECRRMIDAAEAAGVRLMMAYRLHFEEMNLEVVERCRRGELGEVRFFSSVLARNVARDELRRTSIERGGGALYDMGVYCINAARYVFRSEPTQVFAACERLSGTDTDLWTSAQLRFSGGRVAQFLCGAVGQRVSTYGVIGSAGAIEVHHAYDFATEGGYVVRRGPRAVEQRFPCRDQFGPVIDHFARCIRDGRRPEPSGYEGLRDVGIIRALHRSATCGIPISVEPSLPRTRPHLSAALRYTPVYAPPPVAVSRED